MLFYEQDFYNYHSFYTQTFLYGLINKAGGVPLSILHMISYGSPNGEIDEGYI